MSGGSYKNLQGEITVKATCVIASTENWSSLFVLFFLRTNGSYHVAKQAKGAVGKEPLLIREVWSPGKSAWDLDQRLQEHLFG